MTIKGIDVSIWQPQIDWKKVYDDGVRFAILRGAYGTYVDTKFHEHIKGAQAQGIQTGVYVYSIAKNVAEAISEADHVLELIKPYQMTYPVIIDMESEELDALSMEERTRIGIEFCERIENAGYYAMIYANKYWLETKLDYEKLKPYDVWLAQWAEKATWGGNYGIWQTGLGKVNGIGECSVDIAYRDYPSIMRSANLNRLSANSSSAGKEIQVGMRIRYQGTVYASSWGVGNQITVNGTFTVMRVIKNRIYGVQIDQLGWVAEKDCIII